MSFCLKLLRASGPNSKRDVAATMLNLDFNRAAISSRRESNDFRHRICPGGRSSIFTHLTNEKK
jgi:hypothetical protein